MRAFSKMAQDLGYQKQQIIDAEDGGIIEVRKDQVKVSGMVEVQNVYVDGLGIGDVGHVVLRDRQRLSEEGVVVVVVPVDQHTGKLAQEIDIISRGFVFEETAGGILEEAKKVLTEDLTKHAHKMADWRFIRKLTEDSLEKFFYNRTERKPLVLTVVAEV